MLPWFEKHFHKYAVPNLTVYLIALTGAVSSYCILLNSDAGLDLPGKLAAGEWWHIFLFPFRIVETGSAGSQWIKLALFLYFFLIFGNTLEALEGSTRYNIYIFAGIVFTVTGAFLFPGDVTVVYLYFSIILAVAFLSPNMEILLYFIIPVKIKWLAIIMIAGLLIAPVLQMSETGSAWPLLGPVFGFANFLLFYAPRFFRENKRPVLRTVSKVIEKKEQTSIHRCYVCGMTENDDPRMEFRYCVDCDDQEYCMKHLSDHPHVKPGILA